MGTHYCQWKSNRVSTIGFKRKFYCQFAPFTFWRRLLQHSGQPIQWIWVASLFWRCCWNSTPWWKHPSWALWLCHDGYLRLSLRSLCWASSERTGLLHVYSFQLVYQPLYCSHLNTCEYCFHKQNEFLHIVVMTEMKIAMSEGVLSINT